MKSYGSLGIAVMTLENLGKYHSLENDFTEFALHP